MPIYEYQCRDCGHQIEAMQRMADEPLSVCPACARPALKKLISAAAFRLSGSGWYETDFKTGNKKNVAGNAAEQKPETTAKAAVNDNTAAAPPGNSAADTSSSAGAKASTSGAVAT